MPSLRLLFGDEAAVLRERNFQPLLLSAILPMLGTALLSPVLDSLIEPLGTSATDVGLMISVFTGPAIVMIPIAGVLADRYGRKHVLAPSILIFGLAGTMIAFTDDFGVVLGLRFFQGVGFSGINPVIITSIGDVYTGAKEATAQGLRITGTGLSGAVFPLFAGLLVGIGWQYPFLLYAVSVPVAAFVYLRFEEPTFPDAAEPDEETDVYYRALARLLRRRHVFALVVARTLALVIWTAFVTYNSLIVVRLMGGTPLQAGVVFTVASLVFAVVASQTGRITARFDGQLVPLVGANVCLGAGFVIMLFSSDFLLGVVGIGIVGVGFGVTGSLYRAIITGLAPQSLRAGLVGLSEAGGRVMSTLTPIAMGAVIAIATPVTDFTVAIQIAGLGAAVVTVGGSILCLLVAETAPAAPDDQFRVRD